MSDKTNEKHTPHSHTVKKRHPLSGLNLFTYERTKEKRDESVMAEVTALFGITPDEVVSRLSHNDGSEKYVMVIKEVTE